MKPLIVTFTGVDEKTDVERLLAIVEKYTGEFKPELGILFSRKLQGISPRYPSLEWIGEFLATCENHIGNTIRLSAHICGAYAREIMEGNFETGLPLECFGRVQVNHSSPSFEVLDKFSHHIGKYVIAQSRDKNNFPTTNSRVSMLFDPSGGRGQSSTQWPKSHTNDLVGYSGGINPDNLLEMLGRVDAPRFWIDMESGVRTDDYLDLDKVEQVLRQIF